MASTSAEKSAQPFETPARAILRQATRSSHDRLEMLSTLASAELTSSDYATTLARFLAIYRVLEAQIDSHELTLGRLGLDWPRRRKVPSLQRDLEALAGALPVVVPALAGVAPDLTTLPQVLGCMYVLEGATLGGEIIARNVTRVLGLGPENGASFFSSYGAAAGNFWRVFCATLEPCLSNEPARSAAVAAATATFRLFIDQLAIREY